MKPWGPGKGKCFCARWVEWGLLGLPWSLSGSGQDSQGHQRSLVLEKGSFESSFGLIQTSSAPVPGLSLKKNR